MSLVLHDYGVGSFLKGIFTDFLYVARYIAKHLAVHVTRISWYATLACVGLPLAAALGALATLLLLQLPWFAITAAFTEQATWAGSGASITVAVVGAVVALLAAGSSLPELTFSDVRDALGDNPLAEVRMDSAIFGGGTAFCVGGVIYFPLAALAIKFGLVTNLTPTLVTAAMLLFVIGGSLFFTYVTER